MFTTASSLIKWIPYTISGATFNDTNKTITFAGTTSLSGLTTDVTITSASSGQVLKYNGTKWVLQTDCRFWRKTPEHCNLLVGSRAKLKRVLRRKV